MVPTEFFEELRGTWGPPANDPEHRAIWEESMRLLSQIPQLLAEKVRRDGTPFDSLTQDLGSLEVLAELEGQCVENFLCHRKSETFQEVIVRVTDAPPWRDKLQGFSPVKKTRFRKRLGEEITNNLKFIFITNCSLMEWFFPET